MYNKEEVIKELYKLQDIKYRDFTKNIVPWDYTLIGIRMPVLKQMAKDISKGDYKEFLNLPDDNIYEMLMLKFLVIANIKNMDEYKEYFHEYLPKVKNWALCDTLVNSSKIIKKDMTYFWKESCKLIKKKDEYSNRVGFVIMLNYFVKDEYIDEMCDIVRDFKSDKYYANMALAWLISYMYIKFPDKTKEFLLNNNLDKEVINMSIRKIKDSFRVSPENKEWLKKIR